MKRILFLFVLFSIYATAQDAPSYEAHPGSLEITTGYPSFFSMLAAPRTRPESKEVYETGIKYKATVPLNLNIGYTRRISRWIDLSAMVNVSTWMYEIYQFPKKSSDSDQYDFSVSPERAGGGLGGWSVSPMAACRIKWMEKEKVSLYTSLGAGLFVGDGRVNPYPYITPIGVRFGKGRWYGLTEITVSPAATGLLIGGGWRF